MLATYQCARVSVYQQMMGTEVDYDDRDYPALQSIDRLNAPIAFAETISLRFNKVRWT